MVFIKKYGNENYYEVVSKDNMEIGYVYARDKEEARRKAEFEFEDFEAGEVTQITKIIRFDEKGNERVIYKASKKINKKCFRKGNNNESRNDNFNNTTGNL